jgi:hypothetical protein
MMVVVQDDNHCRNGGGTILPESKANADGDGMDEVGKGAKTKIK